MDNNWLAEPTPRACPRRLPARFRHWLAVEKTTRDYLFMALAIRTNNKLRCVLDEPRFTRISIVVVCVEIAEKDLVWQFVYSKKVMSCTKKVFAIEP